MRVQLDVVIEPGGTALTVSQLQMLLPDLRPDVAPALERSSVRFSARIEAVGEEAEVARVVARHLATLRQFSRQFPDALVTVREAPDGGELHLQAGSFGTDEDELSGMLASITGEPQWRLYISFRIERDAHAHVIELVKRAVPAGITPVFDASETALAIGFEIDGDAHNVADLVGEVRLAWRQEGSEAECLVEVEGPLPIVEIARSWSEWGTIEQRLRHSASMQTPAQAAVSPDAKIVELAPVANVGELLGDRWLSWIDDDDAILGIWRGRLYSLPERVEASHPFRAELRRTAGGELHLVHGNQRITVPPAADSCERRFHKLLTDGALFSDTEGTVRASTHLIRVSARGVDEGPRLAHVRGLEATDTHAFALAEGRGGLALFQIQLGNGWGYAEARPWHQDEVATDLVVFNHARIAITAERGSRTTLYLVEIENLVYARQIMLPCVGAEIVAHSPETIWITGMSTPPGPARCDLFRVDVPAGTVTLVTAEHTARTIECIATSSADATGLQLLLATDRAVFATRGDRLREILELAGDESITGMAAGSLSAVFVQSPRGSSLVLGRRDAVIELPAPGYEPRLDDLPRLSNDAADGT